MSQTEERIATTRSALTEAIVAELMDQFPGSPYGDPKILESEARSLAFEVVRRVSQPTLSGDTTSFLEDAFGDWYAKNYHALAGGSAGDVVELLAMLTAAWAKALQSSSDAPSAN